MPTLTPPEIAYLVQTKPFSASVTHRGQPEDATMVAIIMCESGGVTDASGDGGNSYGLAQIHWPTWEGKIPQVGDNPENLYDPNVNINAAWFIFKQAGGKFTDWTCYNAGGYLKHIPKAIDAVANPSKPGSIRIEGEDAPVPNPLDGLKKIVELVEFITDGDNWRRVGLFVGGGAIIVTTLVISAGKSKTVRDVAGAVVPVGRAAKAVKRVG